MNKITVVLITKNEEGRIAACLESVSWADEIVVVDGESQDRTAQIARQFTPKVFERAFDHFSNQKNFGIDQTSGEWIFSIDADEVVSPLLRDSLLRVAREGSPFDGFLIQRINYLFGRRLRFAGQDKEKILRFFRKEKGRFVQPIHEKVQVEGRVGKISGELLHDSSRTVSEYLNKLRLYTDLEVKWLAQKEVKVTTVDIAVKPVVLFLRNYFLRFGFLDGFEGFLYHSLSAFNLLLKYARLAETTAPDTYIKKSSESFSFSPSR